MVSEQDSEIESKLVPILREGIEMVKVILFIKLKEHLAETSTQWPKEHRNRIIGAVLNDIFGINNPAPLFVEFAGENREAIRAVMAEVPQVLGELLIPLTDALRIMVLCDHQEGIDTAQVLVEARDKGVLLADRDLAMPHTFIDLVRRLGSAYGLIAQPTPTGN